MMRNAPSRLEQLTWPDALALGLVAGAIAASPFGSLPVLAFLAAALVTVSARLVLTVRDSRALLDEQRRGEQTDPLTGLGNEHALLEHLQTTLERTDSGRVMVGVFFPDGLGHYYEAYGGLAGDALVRRLAGRLQESVRAGGRAFRPSGDRFVVVEDLGAQEFTTRLAAATNSLGEEGEGFSIEAIGAAVLVPAEADTPDRALLLAGRRLQDRLEDHVAARPVALRHLVTHVLQHRREPLPAAACTLADLARSTARRLELDEGPAARAALAAELLPIGKLAVPHEILAKPGPLSGSEWEFIERHAVIGEHISQVAVEGADVAKLVRASHEHFDGTGYPDGLAGDAIPIEARIASVCGAYEAMLTPRPHRPARSSSEALDELRRNGGSQFDPAVVRAFRSAVAEAQSIRPTTGEG